MILAITLWMKQQPSNVLLLEGHLKSEVMFMSNEKWDTHSIIFELPKARCWFNCILEAMPEKLLVTYQKQCEKLQNR